MDNACPFIDVPVEYPDILWVGDEASSSLGTNSLLQRLSIDVNGTSLSFNPVEQVRCDWALRYGLIPEEGVKFTGSKSAAPIPDKVDAQALAEGMTKQDTILKIRPCVAEMCMMSCPYTRPQA